MQKKTNGNFIGFWFIKWSLKKIIKIADTISAKKNTKKWKLKSYSLLLKIKLIFLSVGFWLRVKIYSLKLKFYVIAFYRFKNLKKNQFLKKNTNLAVFELKWMVIL